MGSLGPSICLNENRDPRVVLGDLDLRDILSCGAGRPQESSSAAAWPHVSGYPSVPRAPRRLRISLGQPQFSPVRHSTLRQPSSLLCHSASCCESTGWSPAELRPRLKSVGSVGPGPESAASPDPRGTSPELPEADPRCCRFSLSSVHMADRSR